MENNIQQHVHKIYIEDYKSISERSTKKSEFFFIYVNIFCYHQHTWEAGTLGVFRGVNCSWALDVFLGHSIFAGDPWKIWEQSVYADPMPTPAPKATDAQRDTGDPI